VIGVRLIFDVLKLALGLKDLAREALTGEPAPVVSPLQST
jgi:hypothetical protein